MKTFAEFIQEKLLKEEGEPPSGPGPGGPPGDLGGGLPGGGPGDLGGIDGGISPPIGAGGPPMGGGPDLGGPSMGSPGGEQQPGKIIPIKTPKSWWEAVYALLKKNEK